MSSLGNSHQHKFGECVQNLLEQLGIISSGVVVRRAKLTVEAASLKIGDTHALRDPESMASHALDNPDYFVNELIKSSFSNHAYNALVNMADTGGDKERHALRLWNRLTGTDEYDDSNDIYDDADDDDDETSVPIFDSTAPDFIATLLLHLIDSTTFGNVLGFLDVPSCVALSLTNTSCNILMDPVLEPLDHLEERVVSIAEIQAGQFGMVQPPLLTFDRLCSTYYLFGRKIHNVQSFLGRLVLTQGWTSDGRDINEIVDSVMMKHFGRAVIPSTQSGWKPAPIVDVDIMDIEAEENIEENAFDIVGRDLNAYIAKYPQAVSSQDGDGIMDMEDGAEAAPPLMNIDEENDGDAGKVTEGDDMDIDKQASNQDEEEDHDDECYVCKEGGGKLLFYLYHVVTPLIIKTNYYFYSFVIS